MTEFASFWAGSLSPYEKHCLGSFARMGHTMTLFSYEPQSGLPDGVQHGDAREIVDPSYMARFITGGRRNIAAFSDYFRYHLFLKTHLCWADADVFVLAPFEIPSGEHFFILEDGRNICNAILRIESASSELREIIRKTEAILDRDVPWAASQNVVAKTFRKRWAEIGPALKDPGEYMPIHFNHYYKLLLPEHADECAEKCRSARAIHLYNNIIDRIGVYKWLLPPEGSYLSRLFTSNGPVSDFCGVYPASVMRTLVEGWRMRFSGECMGAKAMVKQAVPSVARTVRVTLSKYW
jgi:hypothetical protein